MEARVPRAPEHETFELNFSHRSGWVPQQPSNYLKNMMKRRANAKRQGMRMRRPVKKEADDAIRRQKHVNAEAAARALLNDEPNYAEVNNNSHIYGEENARSTSLRPEILELQSEIYALEHANPVNDKKLQNARAMLELMESQQFLERIEDEIPRLIHMYGSESAMVLDMYDTHEKAIDRVDAAVAHLEALRDSGGGRRKTRKTRKTRKHKRHI